MSWERTAGSATVSTAVGWGGLWVRRGDEEWRGPADGEHLVLPVESRPSHSTVGHGQSCQLLPPAELILLFKVTFALV